MDTTLKEELMNVYISLYDKGTPIVQDEVFDFLSGALSTNEFSNEVSFKSKRSIIETYNILSLSNVCIKMIDRDKAYEEIVKLEMLYKFDNLRALKIKHFLTSNKYFYMIPLQTIDGTIVGFIYRSVLGKKDYASIPIEFIDEHKKVPLMFGFYQDFADFNTHETCKPIVVVEGLKDCIFLKQFYPYVLANNTSKIGFNAHILRNITNKIILMYDNDETGAPSMEKDSRTLREMGYTIKSVSISNLIKSDKVKDAAELINYPELTERFKHSFMHIVNNLDRGSYVA